MSPSFAPPPVWDCGWPSSPRGPPSSWWTSPPRAAAQRSRPCSIPGSPPAPCCCTWSIRARTPSPPWSRSKPADVITSAVPQSLAYRLQRLAERYRETEGAVPAPEGPGGPARADRPLRLRARRRLPAPRRDPPRSPRSWPSTAARWCSSTRSAPGPHRRRLRRPRGARPGHRPVPLPGDPRGGAHRPAGGRRRRGQPPAARRGAEAVPRAASAPWPRSRSPCARKTLGCSCSCAPATASFEPARDPLRPDRGPRHRHRAAQRAHARGPARPGAEGRGPDRRAAPATRSSSSTSPTAWRSSTSRARWSPSTPPAAQILGVDAEKARGTRLLVSFAHPLAESAVKEMLAACARALVCADVDLEVRTAKGRRLALSVSGSQIPAGARRHPLLPRRDRRARARARAAQDQGVPGEAHQLLRRRHRRRGHARAPSSSSTRAPSASSATRARGARWASSTCASSTRRAWPSR